MSITDTSRRNFLKVGGAVVGTSLAGLTSKSYAASPALLLSADSGLSALGHKMTGRLILRNQMGYQLASRPNNAVYDDQRPMAVAMCANDKDVSLCINWAKNTGHPFAIRSGGHSYAGFSTTKGLLIDVRAMNKVSLDLKNGLATIQGGANNDDMAAALRNYNLAVPTGRCPTVGAAALCLGGGWGFAATHAGLTCDSLVSTELVLANSQLATANVAENSELFWALRGGGGGNFGVNTSLTFQLHEVSSVTRFSIAWPPGKQVELMALLQDIQLANATTMSSRIKVGMRSAMANPSPNDLVTGALGLYWGSEAEFREIIQPALRLLTPVMCDIYQEGYWRARDAMLTDEPEGLYDIRSNYVEPKLNDAGLDRMLDWMGRWPGGSLAQPSMCVLLAIGGKVRDVPSADTAYVHRSSNFLFVAEAAWAPIDKPAVVAKQQEWLTNYYDNMQDFLQPSTYVNFPSRELQDWAQRYYGSNLARLKQVKRQYDSSNLFRFKQSIPLA